MSAPVAPQPPDEIAALRERFRHWSIALRWTTANSGPDRCQYIATREDGATVAAWSVPALAQTMDLEDRAG
jgi:hypothetical protein